MHQYSKNSPIAPPWSASMSMQASIVLDQPGNISFTNLDEISGRVIVRCSKSVDISTIVVKLEGESRTRLMSSGGPDGERPKPQLEYHKVRLLNIGDTCTSSTDSCRSCTRCRWSSHLPMFLKAGPGWYLERTHIPCRLVHTSIPGNSKFVS
jgi:hypothetical protein